MLLALFEGDDIPVDLTIFLRRIEFCMTLQPRSLLHRTSSTRNLALRCVWSLSYFLLLQSSDVVQSRNSPLLACLVFNAHDTRCGSKRLEEMEGGKHSLRLFVQLK